MESDDARAASSDDDDHSQYSTYPLTYEFVFRMCSHNEKSISLSVGWGIEFGVLLGSHQPIDRVSGAAIPDSTADRRTDDERPAS